MPAEERKPFWLPWSFCPSLPCLQLEAVLTSSPWVTMSPALVAHCPLSFGTVQPQGFTSQRGFNPYRNVRVVSQTVLHLQDGLECRHH